MVKIFSHKALLNLLLFSLLFRELGKQPYLLCLLSEAVMNPQMNGVKENNLYILEKLKILISGCVDPKT